MRTIPVAALAAFALLATAAPTASATGILPADVPSVPPTDSLPVDQAFALAADVPVCVTTASDPHECFDSGTHTCTKWLPDHNPLWVCHGLPIDLPGLLSSASALGVGDLPVCVTTAKDPYGCQEDGYHCTMGPPTAVPAWPWVCFGHPAG